MASESSIILSTLRSISPINFAAVVGFLGLYYVLVGYVQRRRGNDLHRLPGPDGGHWLWGHEKEAFDHTYGQKYLEWIEKIGHTYKIKGAFAHEDLIVTVDRRALSHILTKRIYDYPKSFVTRSVYKRILGKSIVAAEGEDHKRMKAAIGPAFTAEKVHNMESAVVESSNTLVEHLREFITTTLKKEKDEKGVEKKSVLVNAFDWTSHATLDVVGRIGFGYDFKCGTSEVAIEVNRMWRAWVNNGLSKSGFVSALVLRTFPFLASLPLKDIKAQDAVRLRVRELVQPLAEERIAEIKKKGGASSLTDDNDDLLSYLIRASVRNGENIDLDELLDHMNTMLIVGHETSSGVLSYALHILARYPDVQDKLRAEIEAFGKEPDFDDLHNPKVLTYLDAVIKESLRMYPAGAHLEREVQCDDVIPLKTPVAGPDGKLMHEIHVKKGQLVIIPNHSVNRYSDLWGDDGSEFRPSRWLDPSNPTPKALAGGWQGITAFNEGPRMCTGWRLAVFELKHMLATLLSNFRLEDTGLDYETRFMGTLQPFIIGDKPEEGMDGVYMPVKLSLIEQE